MLCYQHLVDVELTSVEWRSNTEDPDHKNRQNQEAEVGSAEGSENSVRALDLEEGAPTLCSALSWGRTLLPPSAQDGRQIRSVGGTCRLLCSWDSKACSSSPEGFSTLRVVLGLHLGSVGEIH